ncbi:MAG: Zn-ribbon domain-containing OB-fold protein [Burkholderiaceae bacterium]
MSGLKRMATSSPELGPRSALERIVMSGPRPFAPRVSAFTQPFWQALSEGRWISTQCEQCKRVSFPPRNLCRACWSRDLHWIELPDQGTLYSFTRVHVAPGAFREDTPYAIGIIDLDQGPRLMCRMVGSIHAHDLDQPVRMLVLDYQDGPLFGARVLTVQGQSA